MTTEAQPSSPQPSRLWTIKNTADFLGVPVATLYRWRQQGSGPRCARIGRHLRYDPADVYRWLDQHRS